MEPHLIEGDHGYGVVGSQYVGEPENVIEPGDYVFTLKLEPLDAYDSNAVPVYLGSVKMGFLSSTVAELFAPVFDAMAAAGNVALANARKVQKSSGSRIALVLLPRK